MSTMRTYDDGSHIDYTYSADGVKLRADYYLNPYIPGRARRRVRHSLRQQPAGAHGARVYRQQGL